MGASMREHDRSVIGDIWTSDESIRNLEELCDGIGSRWAGSDSEHEGGEFLKRKLEEYGLRNVHLEPIEFGAWTRGHCTLTVTSPMEKEFSAIALPYCPSGDVEAPLIDGGNGEQEDIERLGDALRGKLVLVAAETEPAGAKVVKLAHRNDKMRFAADAGAAGVIFVNQNPGLLHITGGIGAAGGKPNRIFGIGVSWEHGQALKRLLKRQGGEITVALSVGGEFFPNTSHNVVGEIEGAAHPDDVILVGAHYDGHDISQAALDDGAGTVVALEAARALAALPKDAVARTIRFVLFCGEEVGLHGSWGYAAAHEDEVPTTRFMLNLDGAGRGRGGTESVTLSGRPELVPWLEAFRDEARYDFRIVDLLNSHSDHYPFAVRGIPSATLMSEDDSSTLVGRGWGHTEADTLDKASLRGLQMSAVLTSRLLLRIASDDDFPAALKPAEELRQQLEDMGLDTALKRSGRWALVGGTATR